MQAQLAEGRAAVIPPICLWRQLIFGWRALRLMGGAAPGFGVLADKVPGRLFSWII